MFILNILVASTGAFAAMLAMLAVDQAGNFYEIQLQPIQRKQYF